MKGNSIGLFDSIDFNFNWGVLRRSKISRAEHHTLFANLEPICSLNASLYSKVGLNRIEYYQLYLITLTYINIRAGFQ